MIAPICPVNLTRGKGRRRSHAGARCGTLLAGALFGCLVAPGLAGATPVAPSPFTVSPFATPPQGATGGDDIAQLGDRVFVGWQNGVGTLGEPAPSGVTLSTIAEYDLSGAFVRQWSVTGKADGMGSDPANGRLIVTVNEDGNSSLYTISPAASLPFQVQHYDYSPQPTLPRTLPSTSASTGGGGVRTGGGTDAVSVLQGTIYISASNPQVLNATAAFRVTLDPSTGIAALAPTFHDNAHATNGVTGAAVTLALTDPDSNDTVPPAAARYGGQFLLDGQGDQQLVFAAGLPASPTLTQLPLTRAGGPAGVDDVRFATSRTLLAVDRGAHTVYRVAGPFTPGQGYASLDSVGATDDSHEVDSLNVQSGALSPFVTGLVGVKGLLFVAAS